MRQPPGRDNRAIVLIVKVVSRPHVKQLGRVREIKGDLDFCQRIRELGFIETALVRKIGGAGPFLCQVNDTRIALGHGAAAQILVAPLPRPA